MKVLLTGSRTWTDTLAIESRLLALPVGTTVMHGGAKGADRICGHVINFCANDLLEEVYPADWDEHGKAAGIIRNLVMLDEEPDLVLAFWDGKSRGTGHTIREARLRGIPVEVFEAA